ncbi:MAG: DUF1905 domain-containing protein [Lachnospiraceae bacterium]|jgi:uncharacterized protein YdhG (YjbR/CyaY superfamily)|nr:DUF1905 domain-containing protein [Lachnospiraceae bacterium]
MELRFQATILQNEGMDAAYVEVPYDIKELFGKGRLLVNATFDGIPYQGQVVKMGTPCYIIGVTRQIRRQIGKSFGDTVEVILQEREREKITMWKCPKCGREFRKKEQSHYCGEKPGTIEEYILSQDVDKQEELRQIRRILREALPEAEERISWSMPTYWKKHNILHFAASKEHIGLYPGPEAVRQFAEELQGYKTDKGTIRIPYGRIDAGLIEKIARWCWETGNHA